MFRRRCVPAVRTIAPGVARNFSMSSPCLAAFSNTSPVLGIKRNQSRLCNVKTEAPREEEETAHPLGVLILAGLGYYFCCKLWESLYSTPTPTTTPLTYELLQQQDDKTSNAILGLLKGNEDFTRLATSEGTSIITRDQEDEVKLAKGIRISCDKGVLKANPDVAPIKKIEVVGKTADEVAGELMGSLPGKEGNIIILQGLSGTGKGTTVGKLTKALPNCVTWSNGNVFRTFTWLASQHCEEKGIEFKSEILTAELLASLTSRLKFTKFDDGFDVVIDGKTRVSSIANTELKKPVISSRVPTVAEQTQGEVVLFAASAVDQLTKAGHNVILEGRGQTLQYISSNNRFELVISDTALLGQRRAAQRVMAAAQKAVGANESATEQDIAKIVAETVKSMQ